jgi:DNA-binding MarR family transcriptional regulator
MTVPTAPLPTMRVMPRRNGVASAVASLARIAEVALETEGLTIQQYRVLNWMDLEPTSTSDLARRLSVSPPVVTRLVQALEARGLVERRTDQDDGRRNTHHIAPQARALLQKADSAIDAAMERVGRSLDAEQRLRADEGLALWSQAMQRRWYETHPGEPKPGRTSVRRSEPVDPRL